MAAARRAAEELVNAGAGRVLLFGSVVRGEADSRSDIDLVAIYDDLGDYSDRSRRRCSLEARAGAAAGCGVDVIVTDAAEWAVRTAKVPCSVEARIAGYAVELADTGCHSGIDWDKEIGLPADPTAELARRFEEMYNAALRLETHLRPSVAEAEAADAGDFDDLRHREDVRLAAAMAEVLAVVESAAKVTHIATVGTAPRWTHNIGDLLRGQPEAVRDAFAAAAGSAVDLRHLHEWRQSNYLENRPQLPSADSIGEHADAALNVAGVAVGHCRRHGISEGELARWGQQERRVSEALDGPIRHSARGGRGL